MVQNSTVNTLSNYFSEKEWIRMIIITAQKFKQEKQYFVHELSSNKVIT